VFNLLSPAKIGMECDVVTVAAPRDYSSLLPIGQLISIVPGRSDEPMGGEAEVYASRVEDVVDGAVVVSMPMRKQTLVPLPLNSTVSAYFHRGGARYYFRAVVGARDDSALPVLCLTQVGELTKQERRSHVRIEALLEPVEMFVVGEELEDEVRRCSSLVVNISAGGLGLVCRRPLPVDSTVHLALELPNGFGRFEADAEVMRCMAVEVGGVRKWRAGVSFQSLSVPDQDRIISFVLYQQRLLRKRGLL